MNHRFCFTFSLYICGFKGKFITEILYENEMKNYTFISLFKKYVSSSLVLIFATVFALIVANSPWGDEYRRLWEYPVSFSIGAFNLFSHGGHPLTFMDLINDFLMAIFFFSVGLEIKREILVGELSSMKKAMLPIIGACGGMLIPVVCFYLTCPGNPDMLRGCAIPMATDIAFSLGVLSMFGKRVPIGLKVFLATLAVADDLGGILVIALFYSTELHLEYLLYSAALILVLIIGNYRQVMTKMFYVLVGIAIWYMFLNSGIHATIAGVIVAFCIPGRPGVTALHYVENIRRKIRQFPIGEEHQNAKGITILSNSQVNTLKSIEWDSDRIISPLQDMEDMLQNPINYIVIPLFAFANAGINLSGMGIESLFQGVGLSIFIGLALGKFLGVFTFSWLSIKMGLVCLPKGSNWKSFASVCMLTGIGFTVSMFIANLSYTPLGDLGAYLLNDAKLGILGGSVMAGIAGWLLLWKFLPKGTAEQEEE